MTRMTTTESEDASSPPRQYYAAQEAICSTCGGHVDLCHNHDSREDIWEVKHEDSRSR